MPELPPAIDGLFLQAILWGAMTAVIRRDVSLQFSVVSSLGLALSITWLNASLCAMITNEIGFISGLLKGLGGFGLILPIVYPALLLAPVSCLIVKSAMALILPKADQERPRVQFSTFDFIGLMSIFAIGAWQLRWFVSHKSF